MWAESPTVGLASHSSLSPWEEHSERSSPSPQTGSPIKRGSCFCTSQWRKGQPSERGAAPEHHWWLHAAHAHMQQSTEMSSRLQTHCCATLNTVFVWERHPLMLSKKLGDTASAESPDLWPKPGGQDTADHCSRHLRIRQPGSSQPNSTSKPKRDSVLAS